MATQNLDLESQEQLAQLQYFWKRYGNLISATIIAASLAFLGWQFYQKNARNRAAQAAVLYEQLYVAAKTQDLPKVERTLSDLQHQYGSTAYAEQGVLLAAAALADSKADAAQAALKWEIDHGGQESYRALARLRLASLLAQGKKYDEALAQLNTTLPKAYQALAADRRGDIYMAQNKADLAKAEYRKAYDGMDSEVAYRKLVGMKLDALGGDPVAQATPAAASASAASSAAK